MRKSSTARAAIAFIASTVAVAVVATMSVLGNKFPSNVFMPTGPEGSIRSVSMLFSQGWGFFTRDAREDRVSIAIATPGKHDWRILDQDAILQPKYAFGLSRLSRAESIDINVLYSAIDVDTEWITCETKGIEECLGSADPVASVRIAPILREPICSSEVALIRETPIPYGYRDLTRIKQVHTVAISVECDV